MRIKFTGLCFLIIILVSGGSAAYVGAAPSFIDFGKVSPGETIEREIYVTTNFKRTFQINPAFSPASRNFMYQDYRQDRFVTSEEDISTWVELESATVDGNTSSLYTLPSGDKITANGKFNMRINIPGDAEPGYHYGTVDLNPDLSSNSDSAGSLNWGETKLRFRFRVRGDVQRQISARDVRAFRLGKSKAEVEVLMRNSGTVTTSAKGYPVDIYGPGGEKKTTLYMDDVKIPPKDSKWVTAVWNSDQKIEQGSYQLSGNFNYITGTATASGSFTLPGFEVVEVRPDDQQQEGDSKSQKGEGIPIWFVVIVLSILGVLMWGFDIEPFWILAILGFFAISAFILMTGLPNWLLAVLIAVVAIVIYGGM